MDCNKIEARRAIAMAEMRIQLNDFSGARTLTLRAQTLYPELGSISQMLSMLDVFLSAERKVGGEVDWYGVLGVDPSADEETIENQYNKLALALHPDQNSLNGASIAFNLVSNARCLLLDRARRSTYDRIAGYQPIELEVYTDVGESSARAGASRANAIAPSASIGGPWDPTSGLPAPAGGSWPTCQNGAVEVGSSSRAPFQMRDTCYEDPFFYFPNFPNQHQSPSGDNEVGNTSETAAKDDNLEAVEFLMDMVDDQAAGNSLFHHTRRMDEDEDEGGGHRGVLGNNPNVAETNEKVGSVYACW